MSHKMLHEVLTRMSYLRFSELKRKPQQYHNFVEKLWQHSGNLVWVRCPQLFNQEPPQGWSWDSTVLTLFECDQELEFSSCVLLISGEIEQGSSNDPDQETTVHESFAFIIPQPGNRFRVCSEKCCLLLSGPLTSNTLNPKTSTSDAVGIRSMQLKNPIINMSLSMHAMNTLINRTSIEGAAVSSPSLRPRAAGPPAAGVAGAGAGDGPASGAGATGGSASFIL